jgi:hypothetical protein
LHRYSAGSRELQDWDAFTILRAPRPLLVNSAGESGCGGHHATSRIPSSSAAADWHNYFSLLGRIDMTAENVSANASVFVQSRCPARASNDRAKDFPTRVAFRKFLFCLSRHSETSIPRLTESIDKRHPPLIEDRSRSLRRTPIPNNRYSAHQRTKSAHGWEFRLRVP